MTESPDRAMLAELSGRIAERLGLHFPEDRWPDLAQRLDAAARELGLDSPGAVAAWLAGGALNTRQIETLASHLTVGETYFLRDPASFALLEHEILPHLIARRSTSSRTLRLWSAGCCTGEEAYSLAISCARAIPDLGSWNVSILATDLNPKFLAKAEAGVYTEWSFRSAPTWLRERHFEAGRDRTWAMSPEIKRLVRFDYLNLAEDVYPALANHTNAMDVIFCRNVLMYFAPERQQRVVAALHRCLVEGGILFVNPAEASASLFPMFSPQQHDGVLVFQKTSGRRRASLAAPAAPPAPAPGPVRREASASVPCPPPVPVAPSPPAAPSPARPDPPPGAPLARARRCADEGRLDEALAVCHDAITVERGNAAAHFLHATICLELGRLDDAVAALGRVLYLDQDFILAHHALGDLYRRLGKPRESRRHLSVALQLLSRHARDEIVPESGGMTCGRLVESVRTMT